jgi:hypothetical protein
MREYNFAMQLPDTSAIDFFHKEWPVIKAAPFSFVICVLIVGLVIGGLIWLFFKERLEKHKETIEHQDRKIERLEDESRKHTDVPTATLSAVVPATKSKLLIHSARYSAVEGGGKSYDVAEFMRNIICGESLVFDIENHNFVFGGRNFVPNDPKTGKPKRLEITYSFDGEDPIAIERAEHSRLVLPEDSTIAELKAAVETYRQAAASATEFGKTLKESLAESERRSHQQQSKLLDWGGEWKLAEDGFRMHCRTDVFAQRQHESPGNIITWLLRGSDSFIRTDVEAACSRAGALLLTCPGFETIVSEDVKAIQSDWQRWLEYLKGQHTLSDLMTGTNYDADEKQVGWVQVGDIRNVAALSASECVKCAAIALRSKRLW